MTSCMADAVVYAIAFPLASVQKVINVSFHLKEYAWMESLRALSQLYYNELRPLGSLDRNSFLRFKQKMKFAKYEYYIGLRDSCLNIICIIKVRVKQFVVRMVGFY